MEVLKTCGTVDQSENVPPPAYAPALPRLYGIPDKNSRVAMTWQEDRATVVTSPVPLRPHSHAFERRRWSRLCSLNTSSLLPAGVELHPVPPWLWKEPSCSHSSSLLKECPPSEEVPPAKPYLPDGLEQHILELWCLRTSPEFPPAGGPSVEVLSWRGLCGRGSGITHPSRVPEMRKCRRRFVACPENPTSTFTSSMKLTLSTQELPKLPGTEGERLGLL